MISLPGKNQGERCSSLFRKIKAYYKSAGSTSCLYNLTPLMIKKTKAKKPKLRAKAGEARDLVPFAKQLADELFSSVDASAEQQAARVCAAELANAYSLLRTAHFDAREMSKVCNKFALQYAALNKMSTELGIARWGLKPKFHLFLEMAEMPFSPSVVWSYRDEDFGGTVSNICSRRGGANSPYAVGTTFFCKFAAMHKVPRL